MSAFKTFFNRAKGIVPMIRSGATLFEGTRFFLYYLLSLIRRKLGFSTKTLKKFRMKKFGTVFDLFITDISDLAIFTEVFVDDAYDVPLQKDPQIIFDIGANVGVTVLYFALKYPDAEVYAFEPDPRTFEKLKRNTKQLPRVQLFQIALGGKNQTVEFYSAENSVSSALVKRFRDQTSIQVEQKTLDTAMSDLKLQAVDFIKFDIEGAELPMFQNFKNMRNVGNMFGEVHYDLMGVSRHDFLKLFGNDFEIQENVQKEGKRSLIYFKNKSTS